MPAIDRSLCLQVMTFLQFERSLSELGQLWAEVLPGADEIEAEAVSH